MHEDQMLSMLRDARFGRGVRCPRCDGGPCPRWGRFNGRQRYRCRQCGRTFSDLTATPAAYTKRLGCWWLYSCLMDSGIAIRPSARRVGVAPSTAFRWRHRILRARRDGDAQLLDGWTEVGLHWFAYSEKGSRRLTRPARLRGIAEPWPAARRGVNVLIATDRLGDLVTVLLGPANGRRLYRQDLEAGLHGRFVAPPILTMAEGHLGPGAWFAEVIGGRYVDSRRRFDRRRDPLAHTRTVEAYRVRLITWLRRFHGVATKYLPNYLAWHRAVDNQIRNGSASVLLRWPLKPGSTECPVPTWDRLPLNHQLPRT